jgi:hypothetical protein
MRAVAANAKATQQTTSERSTTPSRTAPADSRAVNPIFQLQRTIGNQALQRMLRDITAGHDLALAAAASPRLALNFSTIPIPPKAAPASTEAQPVVMRRYANRFLQRKCVCGTAGPAGECAECREENLRLQTKLRINEPGDAYEQEADRVADEVMAKTANSGITSATPRIQRYTVRASGPGDTVPASVTHALAEPGAPLEPALRRDMEQRFGRDFSQVRVHSGRTAEQSAHDVNAHAYTVGPDIVFAAGQLSPQTHKGRRLIAHELTHVVQQSAGGPDRATHGPVTWMQREKDETKPASIDYLADLAEHFLSKYRSGFGLIYDIEGAAEGLENFIDRHKQDHSFAYQFVRAVIHAIPSGVEDNLAAEFVGRLPDTRLNVFALTAEGRAMMNVLYQAIITGDVSSFERQQANRIIKAKMEIRTHKEPLQDIMVFPLATLKVTAFCRAIPNAALQNGKVHVYYPSDAIWQCKDYKADVATLGGREQKGIDLDPNQLVFVRNYDEDEALIPIPALALIDFSNQLRRAAVGKGMTAFFLGLTFGMGGLGGAGAGELAGEVKVAELAGEIETATAARASLLVARAVLWADRIAVVMPAVSMVVNEHRQWILDKFPNVGRAFLDTLDWVNSIAAYYGWARLGLDGFRLVRAKVTEVRTQWQAKAAQRNEKWIKGVDQELEKVLNDLEEGEAQAAVDYVDREHPEIINRDKPGQRRVKTGGNSEIVEVVDGCEYRSSPGIKVKCPVGMGTSTSPSPRTLPPTVRARTALLPIRKYLGQKFKSLYKVRPTWIDSEKTVENSLNASGGGWSLKRWFGQPKSGGRLLGTEPDLFNDNVGGNRVAAEVKNVDLGELETWYGDWAEQLARRKDAIAKNISGKVEHWAFVDLRGTVVEVDLQALANRIKAGVAKAGRTKAGLGTTFDKVHFILDDAIIEVP